MEEQIQKFILLARKITRKYINEGVRDGMFRHSKGAQLNILRLSCDIIYNVIFSDENFNTDEYFYKTFYGKTYIHIVTSDNPFIMITETTTAEGLAELYELMERMWSEIEYNWDDMHK